MFKLKFKKRKIEETINFIWIGVFFGLCYWVLESVRDVIVFERGNIVERIFTPDPMSFWMRLLVVCVIVLFSANAQSIRKRLDVRRKDRDEAKPVRSIIRIGLGFGALYWFLESLRDAFVFEKGNILQRILVPDPMGFWMRILAVCIIVLFSIYAQGLINARIRTEEKLEEEREELEKRVYERTTELSKSNELLKKEVEERNRIELELRKVNRTLMALSESNLALARATKETNLLKKICDILIKVGGYRFVWVGMAEKKVHNIRPMSKSGNDDDYVQNIKFRWDKANKDGNPIGKTIVSGKPTIVNYITESTTTNPWYQEAVRRGYQVSISLPLKYNDQTFGALNIYSDDQHAFDAEEVKLMEELASGLAFGLTALKTKVAHKQAEDDKVNIQAQLNQAQKVEAIGVLTGGIAHDFNNILTAIRISADIAIMEIDGDSPAKKDLKEIYKLTERAAELISQLLLFSRKHQMEYKNVIINTLVQDLQRMLKHLIGEDIQIHTDLDPDLWTVRADRGTIDQVVMNLVVNARDALPDGGEIAIKTTNIELDETQCQYMPEGREGKFVCLSVEDTGVGIDENILPDIFDPFFSTKDPGKGTGLGLSVVYGIIKQHDGWMNVSSKVGEGTIFYVYFPCVEGQVVDDKEKQSNLKNEKSKGKRILYIEDEEKVRTFTAKALRRGGYEIFEAATAAAAMNEFEREEGEFHLVISDVVLPDQNGVDLVEQILVKKPELPVLLCSGYTDHKASWETIQSKGFPFLQKPYSVSDIMQIIQELAA